LRQGDGSLLRKISLLSPAASYTLHFPISTNLLSVEYGVKRYVNETRRLYGVLNTQLEKSTSGYLVGDRCTIADIAHWGW
jgi:glutathione S-transferase